MKKVAQDLKQNHTDSSGESKILQYFNVLLQWFFAVRSG